MRTSSVRLSNPGSGLIPNGRGHLQGLFGFNTRTIGNARPSEELANRLPYLEQLPFNVRACTKPCMERAG